MTRYCRKEYGYFADSEFTSTGQGFIHEMAPRHYARTGMLVSGTSIDQTATFWVTFSPVLAKLVEEAPVPLEGFGPHIVPCLDADDDATALRLEILRLTDRLSNEDLRAFCDQIRRRLTEPPERSL
jgi:hypothetical protein